ncbi:SpoIIE family protein phosphatase [Nocardioides sp. dk4132]|uniref:PP2C family protein-serine/threonine phosphatase n=1 Tax=unclassified Nocardioides TaxID=2615069 RepID=UPI001297902F|nr:MULTISPECIES: PP2C family protein-serine/threonine phosphatase [unclassified Nocardioides]MQW77930.1 SpoIIE family protein phosphatase [Nocardioides sp. dk4132]QGA09146.1 SpoIIE family protein phosphatase [Nocardioides sp. dk884]
MSVAVEEVPASWVRDPGVWAGLSIVLLVAMLDRVSVVALTGGFGIGALVTAMISTARRTAGVGLVALAATLLVGSWSDDYGPTEFAVRGLTCLALGVLALVSAETRERREARLRRLTVIADAAQRAVLRASPERIGTLGFAVRYVSATEEAAIGGDLYEIAATPFGVRVIVGDVRGKGLPAVQTAASVLGAFRQAALSAPDPAALARRVDDVISRLIDEEEFVTAVFAEFRDDGTIALANCGHHPPLLLDADGTRVLDTGEPTPPLGLMPDPELVVHPWRAGGRVLFYTDGLVEARDEAGEFFGLDPGAQVLTGRPLPAALDRLVERLSAHVGGRVTDDVALVLVEDLTHARVTRAGG